MKKILIYGDVHWSTYSSIIRSRGKEYSTRLENLIKSVNWAERLAEEKQCDAVICLGDFFDKPDLNAEELSALLKINWARQTVQNHYFIVGNHETTLSSLIYNSTNALNLDKFHIINKPHRIITYGADMLFLPYISEENRRPLKEYWEETEEDNMFTTQEVKNGIIFSHNDLKDVQYGAYTSQEGFQLKDIESNSNLYINGHIHNGQFVNDKKTILNLGVLTGQNFSEDAYKYPHVVCILDVETLELEFFENPHAFNFYKLEITKESDLTKLSQLKNNAVITVRCEESLVPQVRETINSLDNIIESRVISYRDLTNENNIEHQIEFNQIDHLKQFYDFVLNKVEDVVVPRDILLKELERVIKING